MFMNSVCSGFDKSDMNNVNVNVYVCVYYQILMLKVY